MVMSHDAIGKLHDLVISVRNERRTPKSFWVTVEQEGEGSSLISAQGPQGEQEAAIQYTPHKFISYEEHSSVIPGELNLGP